MPLIPAIVDAVFPTVVIAAGGIGDGRGIAAALMLGASGVWLGTRFLTSEEALTHEFFLKRLLEAGVNDTHYGEIFNVGWENAPHRVLTNSTVNHWLKVGSSSDGQRPGEVELHWLGQVGQVGRRFFLRLHGGRQKAEREQNH